MANNNTVDKKLPVQYILPDGDIVQVPTWEWIIDRMEENLNPLIDQLALINDQLGRVNNRLGQLITNADEM